MWLQHNRQWSSWSPWWSSLMSHTLLYRECILDTALCGNRWCEKTKNGNIKLTFIPSPGDLHDPGIKPRSPSVQPGSLPPEPPGKLNNLKAQLNWLPFHFSLFSQTWLVCHLLHNPITLCYIFIKVSRHCTKIIDLCVAYPNSQSLNGKDRVLDIFVYRSLTSLTPLPLPWNYHCLICISAQ